jgi:hypothetical protein
MASDVGKAIQNSTNPPPQLASVFDSEAIPQIPESVSSANEAVLRTRPSASSLTSTASPSKQLSEEQRGNLMVRFVRV